MTLKLVMYFYSTSFLSLSWGSIYVLAESQNGSRAANGAGRGGYSGGLGGAGDGRAPPLPGGNRLIASAINRLPQSRVAVPPYSRASQPPPRPSRIPNVRENLFGTALDGDEMKDVPVADLDDVVVPSMNGFGGGGGGGGGDRGGRRERNEQSNVSFQVSFVFVRVCTFNISSVLLVLKR